MNPYSHGKRHEIGLDLFVKGFPKGHLSRAYLALTNTRETDRLILECATFEEMDAEYNPGEPLEEGIYEAVTVRRFSQTDSRMRALSRVFSKFLPETITPAEAIIGKPKKTGLFASVMAQIPFSDGQAITIVFHSPSGDAKKIGPDDEIIAYRWLLNKRDITHVVSPEGEADVSLEEVGKRIAQLVAKNSDRFQKAQKDIIAQNQQLDALKSDTDKLSKENMDLMNGLKDQQDAAAAAQTRLDQTRGLLQKQQEINADLENQLAALQAKSKANDAGKAVTDEASKKVDADAASVAVPDATGVPPKTVREPAPPVSVENPVPPEEATNQTPGPSTPDVATVVEQQPADGTAVVPAIPDTDLPDGWSLSGPDLAQPENEKRYAGTGSASVAVTRMANPYRVLAYDGKQPISHEDVTTIEEANQKAIDFMNNYDQLLNDYKAAIAEPVPPAEPVIPDPVIAPIDSQDNAGNKPDQTITPDEATVVNQEVAPAEPAAPVEPTPPEPGTPAATPEPPAVATLNDLLSGKYDSDTAAFGNMLDDAAGQLEAAGLLDQYDSLLNQTADYLTGLLRKKAA